MGWLEQKPSNDATNYVVKKPMYIYRVVARLTAMRSAPRHSIQSRMAHPREILHLHRCMYNITYYIYTYQPFPSRVPTGPSIGPARQNVDTKDFRGARLYPLLPGGPLQNCYLPSTASTERFSRTFLPYIDRYVGVDSM